jgi:hypothetical protein
LICRIGEFYQGLLTNQPNLANRRAKIFEAFAMHLATKIISHTVRTPRARTHQQQLAELACILTCILLN